MTACLLWCCLNAAAAPAPDEPLVLLAGTDEYKTAKGTEAVYEGVIDNNPGDGAAVGKPTRFNTYRFSGKDAAGKAFVREMYVPGKAFLLAAFVGKRVRITGKFADTTADGKVYLELWPARIEEATVTVAAPPVVDGVHARCAWQPDEARRIGKRVFVYRNGREMARGLRLTGDATDETAGGLMAQKLDRRGIDWDKQMVVAICAGLRGADVDRLTVTRVEVKDRTTTVYYQMAGKPGAGGFGYPAETVLVDRFDGAVHAEEEPAAPQKAPAVK